MLSGVSMLLQGTAPFRRARTVDGPCCHYRYLLGMHVRQPSPACCSLTVHGNLIIRAEQLLEARTSFENWQLNAPYRSFSLQPQRALHCGLVRGLSADFLWLALL